MHCQQNAATTFIKLSEVYVLNNESEAAIESLIQAY